MTEKKTANSDLIGSGRGRRRSLLRIVGGLLAISLLAAVVAGVAYWIKRGDQADGRTNPVLIDTAAGEQGALIESGAGEESFADLLIRLSQGQAQPQTAESRPPVSGEPLSDDEVARILARLPELALVPGDQVSFRLPEELLPPPRPGETVSEAFPPPAAPAVPPEVAAGPLEVLRYGPEGEIALAPFVNVTFNQPMVPLATLEALGELDVPVRLEPSLPGVWKWIGTKTLSFEYESDAIDRLPMATEYRVTVPAGTRSATGGALAQEVSWTFTTPPPTVITTLPWGDAQPLEPVFLVAFDQRIDPSAVLATIQVTANGQAVAVRLASDEELAADKRARRAADQAEEGRWLAFVAESPLPKDAAVDVVIGPGTPSAEGPLLTTTAQSYSFRTYAPLTIERFGCSWYDQECPPLTPFFIEFNNPIDVAAYQESMLEIEPALAGAVVNIVGDTITVRGATVGRTDYRLTVDGAIQDVFGQTLGKNHAMTIKVGSAEPALYGPEEALVTLDPAAREPVFTVYAINFSRLRVRAYAVEPSDWPAFKTYLQDYYRQGGPPKPPGRQVMDDTITLEAADDQLTEVSIDLTPALDGETGQLVVVVEPAGLQLLNRDRYRRVAQAWVQVTQIGLDALADHSELVAWTTALKDGAPLTGVTLGDDSGNQLAVTDETGTARFPQPASGTSILIARLGDDLAILPRSGYAWGEDSWTPWSVLDELRWYVFDDRAMYRPGEEVHVKGWLRRVGGRQNGDVGLPGEGISRVDYRVIDPQGNELGSGGSQVNALGGFDLAFTLPTNANLGYAQLEFHVSHGPGGLDGTWYSHSFQIQEFRRPEFEVKARNETPGPFFVGDQAVVAVEAAYYAGGPLPNAEVTWQVSSTPSSYSPPNWPDFTFGTWSPWWYYGPIYVEAAYPFWEPAEPTQVETYSGVTDPSGTHYLRLDFETAESPRPHTVLAEATVMDVNRQAWTGSTSLLVHPADLYVGLRGERTFVERGTPLVVDVIVTDLDGEPVPDRPVEVTASRMEWMYRQGAWREEPTDTQTCSIGSGPAPVSCTFETPVGGEYQITAVVADQASRPNRSQLTRWVSGGQRPPARQVELETVMLIPDKESYQPGDVAQILVQAPFSPAEGLLTVGRSGLLYTERFRVEQGTATLQVPIEEEYIPNLILQVDLVGAAPRSDDQGQTLDDVPPRPAYASGQLNLSIPPLQRALDLAVTPRDRCWELEPGGQTTIDVVLTDAAGQPVPDAELAVVVVDEAVLALTNYQLTDPLAAFYLNRPSHVATIYGRASIVLVNPATLSVETPAPAQVVMEEAEVYLEKVVEVSREVELLAGAPASADMANEAQPIRVRIDFNPLATFSPAVRTDASGRASVPVSLPDNLTRYRVMVVAVAGNRQFGSAEANLTARLPLMVRPSAPRFLNFGDQFELPVVLQNQTDQPLEVEVVVQASNLELTQGPGQRVTVPARDRVEVRFPATTVLPGTARLQIAAVSGTFADAAAIELPVYTPATTEAFATYGVVDQGAVAQPVAAPADVYPQFGGLEISTSSTALQALTDAVLYLVSYRYECSEQLASRMLAVAALRDVLTAFSAAGLPSPEAMEAAVLNDIEKLQGMQNWDGGFPYWERGRDTIPFNTIHVAHALQRAEMMGFAVPSGMKDQVADLLRRIEDTYPHWYGQQTRWTLSAYALYVRDLMGDTDRAKARQLLNEAGLEGLSLEAVAWLWQVLVDDPNSAAELEAIRRLINNRAVETAGAANFTTAYGDQAYLLLHSDRRTDALILEALIADDPTNDLIPKVVNGLLAHRTRGRWNNTQENVFILLALDRYFDVYEAQTPDFVARIWLGEAYVGSHTYAGRTTERHETEIPMAYLTDLTAGGTQDLILSKEGTGRLYYRLGLSYAPTDLWLDPLDMGFVVQRGYEAVDDPADVSRDADGVWHIRAGARVRVRLTMVADNRRYHVALVDPLPAGLEIVNPALAVSGSVPQDPTASDYRYGWWWWGPWYEHQNMRDERAEAFTPLLWEGVYTYSYVARATTPGTFVVPPAKAEEMYSPEVFGRSGSDWVIVK